MVAGVGVQARDCPGAGPILALGPEKRGIVTNSLAQRRALENTIRMRCPSIDCPCCDCTKRERALDVQAALYALKNARETDDIHDKMAAVELAVKRRRAPVSALLGFLLAVGCGASAPESVDTVPPTFAPSAELFEMTEEMSTRYEAATGRSFEVSSHGFVRVELQDEIPSVSKPGAFDCGQTVTSRYDGDGSIVRVRVLLDPTPPDSCSDMLTSLLHEAIHALAPDAEHAAEGLFARSAKGSKIDEPALGALCPHFGCYAFQPE
jgi:hypothetical protein